MRRCEQLAQRTGTLKSRPNLARLLFVPRALVLSMRGLRALPNPFWIVPVFEWLEGEPRRARSPKAERERLLGAGILAAQVLDDFLMWDWPHDEALGFETDHPTQVAFEREPERIWPISSEAGRGWTRLWSTGRLFTTAKTRSKFQRACNLLREELIADLRAAYEQDHEIAPGLRRKFDKESLLRALAIYRFDIVTHRSRSLFGMSFSPPGADKSYEHYLREASPPHETRLKPYLQVLADLVAHLGDRELASAVRRTRGGDLYAGFERHRGTIKHFVDGEPIVQVRRPDPKRFLALREARVEPPEPIRAHFELLNALQEHPLDLLDTEESLAPALGAELCRTVIIGEIHQGAKALPVLRIQHGNEDDWVSFCVLVERRWTLSNPSSWLVFVRAGGAGTGGFSSGEYHRVMSAIAQHREAIDLRTIRVPYPEFRRIITQRQPWRASVNTVDRQRRALGGRMIEFLAREALGRRGYETHLSFHDPAFLGKKEVDVLALHHERRECLVVECTASWKPEADAIEVDHKVRCMRKKYPSYDIRGIVVIPRRELHAPDRRRGSHDPPWPETPNHDAKLWILEDDILPSIPPEFRKDDIIATFQETVVDHSTLAGLALE